MLDTHDLLDLDECWIDATKDAEVFRIMAMKFEWANNIAWVADGLELNAMLMPDGPVVVLTGADVIIDHMYGMFSVDDVVASAMEALGGDAKTLKADIAAFVGGLSDAGFLVPADPE